jgi:AcrR family transcriptional regulator
MLLVAKRLDNVYTDNMAVNDNSVNIKSVGRNYHHGDLRSALIEAGLELLKKRGADELSLREIARSVGVSATAVYRHFPDKQELVNALCRMGAEQLASAQVSASKAIGGGREGFDAMGQAYVRFALANPALFRLMMSNAPDALFAGNEINVAMQLLKDSVASLLPAQASDRARNHATIHAWSMVHGMAMLMLDGMVPAEESTIQSISSAPLSRAG